jgi:hypothetical protein
MREGLFLDVWSTTASFEEGDKGFKRHARTVDSFFVFHFMGQGRAGAWVFPLSVIGAVFFPALTSANPVRLATPPGWPPGVSPLFGFPSHTF